MKQDPTRSSPLVRAVVALGRTLGSVVGRVERLRRPSTPPVATDLPTLVEQARTRVREAPHDPGPVGLGALGEIARVRDAASGGRP